MDLQVGSQDGRRARVVGDPDRGRMDADDRVRIAVLGLSRLAGRERVRDLELAVVVDVELDQGHMTVRVRRVDDDLGRGRRPGRRGAQAQPPRRARVRRVDGERPPLAAGAAVLVGRADADLARARGERGRDARAGRVVVGAVTVEIPCVREPAPGTARRQHHHGPRARRGRDGADRGRRTPRFTGRRVAAGNRVARRGAGRDRDDRGHREEDGRPPHRDHPGVGGCPRKVLRGRTLRGHPLQITAASWTA